MTGTIDPRAPSHDERLLTLLERIARALESQARPDDELLSFELSKFSTFDWSSINATVVARDEQGVSAIRTENGRIAKRRTNDRYGADVWFSYSAGKDEHGANQYRKVVEFKTFTPAEPMGRKTESAIAKSASAQKSEPPDFAGRAAAQREKAIAARAGRSWASSVEGLTPTIDQKDAIRAVYTKLEGELAVRLPNDKSWTHDRPPASLAEAIARAKVFAAKLDELFASDQSKGAQS